MKVQAITHDSFVLLCHHIQFAFLLSVIDQQAKLKPKFQRVEVVKFKFTYSEKFVSTQRYMNKFIFCPV